MSEIVFHAKVFSIHPTYDQQGTEYVCIELGFKPPKMPTMVPSDVPKEVSDIIQASKDMVKVMVPPQLRSQLINYAKRITIFLAPEEWTNLEKRYTVGDEYKVIIKSDGSLLMTEI